MGKVSLYQVMGELKYGLLILKVIGLAPDKLTPYAMGSTIPLGVPRVFSLTFWGGIWGFVLALSVTWMRDLGYWLSGLIVGSLGPSLINWFVVLPLKGEPIGGGWAPPGVATALIINGAWGLGTVFLHDLANCSLDLRSPSTYWAISKCGRNVAVGMNASSC